MGDSTRRRLAGVVQSANAGGGADGRAAGVYVGGYAGGMGGTWGKAPTGRGDMPSRPGGSNDGGVAAVLGGGGPAAGSPMQQPRCVLRGPCYRWCGGCTCTVCCAWALARIRKVPRCTAARPSAHSCLSYLPSPLTPRVMQPCSDLTSPQALVCGPPAASGGPPAQVLRLPHPDRGPAGEGPARVRRRQERVGHHATQGAAKGAAARPHLQQ